MAADHRVIAVLSHSSPTLLSVPLGGGKVQLCAPSCECLSVLA